MNFAFYKPKDANLRNTNKKGMYTLLSIID